MTPEERAALPEAVRALDAATCAMNDAQQAWCEAKRAVVVAACAAGLTARSVLIIGRTAWYVDPPGSHGNADWSVTWGSPPEKIAVEGNT